MDLLLFAQTLARPGGALGFAALAVGGSLLGCLFLYGVSRKGGEMALRRRTTPERVTYLREKFEKYDALTLVLPAMIPLPLPMKMFVIAAGVFQVRVGRFVAAVLVGRVVRYFGVALLAQRYGEDAWRLLRENAIALGIGAVALLALFFGLSQLKRKNPPGPPAVAGRAQ